MKPIQALSIALAVVMLIGATVAVGAQEGRRVALVIGNATYKTVPVLANPTNDATDMSAALKGLGFEVITLIDGTYVQMLDAVEQFRRALNGAAVGLFYYAGHGIQSQGQNYLLPVDATITQEYHLRAMALDAGMVLDAMSTANAGLNIVIMDACRNNPYTGTGRSVGGSRGLVVMGADLRGALIAYATDPGKEAQDGTGRNGVYTAALLRHLATPGLDIKKLLDRVGAEVSAATGGAQTPWYNSKFYGEYSLAGALAPTPPPVVTTAPAITVTRTYGSIEVTTATAGTLYIDGALIGELPSGEARLDNIQTGSRSLEMRYATGDKESRTVTVQSAASASASFTWKKPAPGAASGAVTEGRFVRLPGGTFTMGSPSTEQDRSGDEGPQHQVTVSAFSIGVYEVTVGEFKTFVAATGYKTTAEREGGGYVWTGTAWEKKADATWKNPYFTQTDTNPVVLVSWYDAVAYCNWRSQQEKRKPAYTIRGTNVTWDRSANGYRLPTEAEWEYACRASTATAFAFGDNLAATQANFNGYNQYKVSGTGSYLQMPQPVGSYTPNKWNIYDMHGNVWEWCWDWYGSYMSADQTDPVGASSGTDHVTRGGSWNNGGQTLRSAKRGDDTPDRRDSRVGFRLVLP